MFTPISKQELLMLEINLAVQRYLYEERDRDTSSYTRISIEILKETDSREEYLDKISVCYMRRQGPDITTINGYYEGVMVGFIFSEEDSRKLANGDREILQFIAQKYICELKLGLD